jgi:hypothetical protein
VPQIRFPIATSTSHSSDALARYKDATDAARLLASMDALTAEFVIRATIAASASAFSRNTVRTAR